MLQIAAYENDTLAHMLPDFLEKSGVEFEFRTCNSSQPAREDEIVIRSPFSNGWMVDAPNQVFIQYDQTLVDQRLKNVQLKTKHVRGSDRNNQYARRMVKNAFNELYRRFVQMRPSRKEREALGMPTMKRVRMNLYSEWIDPLAELVAGDR